MSAIEKLAQKDKQAQLKENPERVELKGPTVSEILSNDKQSELFGLYLEGEGDEARELGEKLKAGDAQKLGREEFAELNNKRRGFLELLENSKNAIAVLDARSLKELVEKTPGLKDLAEVAGPEKMRKAITDYLPRMAIMDRERFQMLSESIVDLREKKRLMAEKDKEVSRVCKELGLREDEYVDIIAQGDRKELEKIVKQKMGFWEKRFTRSKTIEKKAASLDLSEDMRTQIREIDDEMRNVGDVLQIVLMDNDILHEALVANMTKEGEAPKVETGMAFSEVKKPQKEDVEKKWGEFRKEYESKYGFDPDNVVDWQREKAVNEFTRGYAGNAVKGKKGFWASVSEALWSSMAKDFLKKA